MENHPFQNTKATYFDDEEIVKLWVDTNYATIKDQLILPESSIPCFILGGKGVGKTHVLRYFSFQAQKIRAERKGIPFLELVKEEKYIGAYIVASNLGVYRFSGRGIAKEEWNSIFYYYINLEIIEILVKKIIQVLKDSDVSLRDSIEFSNIFTEKTQYTLNELSELVTGIKKDLDKRISTLSMPGADPKAMHGIQPIFALENSSFEIINTIIRKFSDLEKIDILIIVDEFENLSKEQQIFFNTLLRHPPQNNSIKIRIAGRLYSVKTRETLDDKERLLNDSEVRFESLEDCYKHKFEDFAKELHQLRSGRNVDFKSNFVDMKEYIDNSLSTIQTKINNGAEKKHFAKFQTVLKNHYSISELDQIVTNLSYKDILIEKANILLCYKADGFPKGLVEYSVKIKNDMAGSNLKKQDSQLDKFRDNFIFQIFKDYRVQYYYCGYPNIVKLANYNPRIFLSILNNIDLLSKNRDIFTDIIDAKVQHLAIIKTSDWFWNNFTEDIQDNNIVKGVHALCNFFKEARASIKPVEKTLTSFYYDSNQIDPATRELVELATNHSLFLPFGSRKDKNNATKKVQLKVHPMLAPKYELPLAVGGTPPLNKDEMEALFSSDRKSWDEIHKKKVEKLKPSFLKSSLKDGNPKTKEGKPNTRDLFDTNVDSDED